MDSYDVRFWDTKKIADNASGGRYRVRWAVNGQEHCKSFKNKTLADGFLDNLKDAARDRRPFSPRTGLPAAEPAEEEMVTWYEHARSYAKAKWPTLAPVSRRSVAEALVTVTVALSGKEKGAPEARVLRRALFAWAFNPATRESDPPREIALALGWAARASLPVAALDDPATVRVAARGRFRRALDELAVVSLVALPSAASRSGWDAIVEPPLPVWVTRVDHETAGPAAKPAPRVWPSALEAAGRIASRPDEHAVLERVADWRRDNPAPVRVPVGERSAELFGDEKALGRFRKTRLFTSGALTLDLLACYDPPLPFASQHVPGAGPVVLPVAENLATYTSFLTAARSLGAATRPDLHVAWGIGGSFEQSVLSIPLLDPQPRHVRYFRDLDRAGLRIAASAARQAARAASRRCFPRPGATSSC